MIPFRAFSALVFVCAASFVSADVLAGELGPPPKRRAKAAVKWTVKNEPLTAAPGETVKLELHAEIPSGYYTYTSRKYPPGGPVAAPPTFAFDPKDIVTLEGTPAYSEPKLKKTEEGDVEILEKEATFTLSLKVAAAATGEQNIKLLIDSQVCDEKTCVPSFGTPVPFVIKIGAPTETKTEAKAEPKKEPKLAFPGLGELGTGLGGLGGIKTTPKMKWTVKNAPLSGARGEVLKLELQGEIPDGHYTYPSRNQGPGAAPTEIKPAAGAPFGVHGAIVDPPTKKKDYAGLVLDIVEKDANFTVPIRIAPDAAPGAYNTKLVVNGQVCNATSCFPSNDVEVPFVLTVSDAPVVAGASAPANTEPPKSTSSSAGQGGVDDIAKARQEGLWSFLKLSMLTGFLALLTPCVFPMIPITVSFFTKRKQATRGAAIRDAGVYAIGIICAFVVLGFLFTFLLGATGVRDFATNPWANIVVAVVFMALAFSLFGAYEIQLPTSVMNALNKKAGEGEGVLSVLLMGIVFALTSFTCTVPFIGAVLVTATQGDLLWPAVGMLGFATVFAAPFLVLAVIPALLKSLPKSGGWLNSVKVVMGFLEIAAALKFMSNVDLGFQWGILTRELFLAIWVALTLMIVFYLLGKFQMTHDSPVEKIGAARATLATCFLGLAVWMMAGLFGMKLGELDAFIPPRIYPGQTEPSFGFALGGGGSKEEKLAWNEDFDAAMAEAKKRNVPVFVDFTGDQCTNCRLMEENMFPRPEIRALLGQFVRAKLVTDRKFGPDRERSIRYVKMQEERFDTSSLPFYVILSPDDKVLATFDGLTRDPKAFEAFLKKGLGEKPVQTAAR